MNSKKSAFNFLTVVCARVVRPDGGLFPEKTLELTCVSPSGLCVTDYIPWGISPTGKDQKMKNQMSDDWTPACEPVVAETETPDVPEVSEETETIEVEPTEIEQDEETGPTISVDTQASLEDYFGPAEDGLDLWNNWFHGLGVRDLTDLLEEGRIPQKLSELHGWLREYRQYRWLLVRKDRETGDLTPEAVQAVAWGQANDVDFLDPAGAFGEVDLAVKIFGPRLVKLYQAVLVGRCGRHSVLGQLKTDWHSDALMQAMGQPTADQEKKIIFSGVEPKLRMYHSSPLAEGETGQANVLNFRADVRSARYLDEGVFDGVGRHDLSDPTPAASDPNDEGYRIRLWKEQAIGIGYVRSMEQDAAGQPTGKWVVRMQDHFPVWEENDLLPGGGSWVPAPALDIHFCQPRLQKLNRPTMGWKNVVQKDGEIVRKIVRVSATEEILVPQKDYKSIWDVLDGKRDQMISAASLMALAEKGSAEWTLAYQEHQQASYWYRVFKQFALLYKDGLANSWNHHLYGEWLNGIRPSGEKIIVNYRVFTLEIASRQEAENAGMAGAFQKKEAAWLVQDEQTRTETPILLVRGILFSKLSRGDMLPAIAAEQQALRDKETRKWDAFRQAREKQARERKQTAAKKTGGLNIR